MHGRQRIRESAFLRFLYRLHVIQDILQIQPFQANPHMIDVKTELKSIRSENSKPEPIRCIVYRRQLLNHFCLPEG